MTIPWVLILALCIACAPNKAKRIEEAEIHFRIANQLLAKNENVQALAEALKASELDPNNAEVANFLGLSYAQRQDFIRAEKYLREAIRLTPAFSQAHNNLCALLIERTQYDEAISQCLKAIENVTYATPERSYHNMGMAYERKGDLEKAQNAYKKGLIHNRNFVMSLKALGKIYYSKKMYTEAAKNLESAAKVCQVSPKGAWQDECVESYYRLALTYVALRKRKDAILMFRSCVDSAEETSAFLQSCQEKLRLYQ